MKRIIPYKLFESNVPFTRENIQKSIRDKINEPEVESIITDMCADFIDEYNVAIHFDWGWAVSVDQIRRSGVWHGKFDLRKDSEIKLIKNNINLLKRVEDNESNRVVKISKISDIQEYIREVSESSTRYVQVFFDRYDRGTQDLNIWKRGFDLDFINIMDFVRNYFPNAEIKQDGNITPESWAARFNVIFK